MGVFKVAGGSTTTKRLSRQTGRQAAPEQSAVIIRAGRQSVGSRGDSNP